MSTQVPVLQSAIPTPNDDPTSVIQAVLAIKQTLEHDHGFMLGKARVPKTAAGIAIGAAISAVTKTLP